MGTHTLQSHKQALFLEGRLLLPNCEPFIFQSCDFPPFSVILLTPQKNCFFLSSYMESQSTYITNNQPFFTSPPKKKISSFSRFSSALGCDRKALENSHSAPSLPSIYPPLSTPFPASHLPYPESFIEALPELVPSLT